MWERLALQFLLEGARLGEEVICISLSDTKEEMETIAASHDWDLGKLNLFEHMRGVLSDIPIFEDAAVSSKDRV